MHRRDFIKIGGTIGSVIPFWALTPAAFSASADAYTGKILVNVLAGGALDQSSWTDPRIAAWNSYNEIEEIGNIRFAPIGNNRKFFNDHYKKCLVINGINSGLNHVSALRFNQTGSSEIGYPNIAEWMALTHGSRLPFPSLVGEGGYPDEGGLTTGLMPPNSIPLGAALQEIVDPNSSVPGGKVFMSRDDVSLIQQAQTSRVIRLLDKNNSILPRTREVLNEFGLREDRRSILSNIGESGSSSDNRNIQDADVGLVLAAAGVTTTIQLMVGNTRLYYDTHGNHDVQMSQKLPRLTNLIDFIWTKAKDLELHSRLLVRIFSEFGRTPSKNSGNGKDHWPVGSQVWMADNPTWGNRVFGASGPQHHALAINSAGAVVKTGGTVLRPYHLHEALRTYLDIKSTHPKFNLRSGDTTTFDFFGTGPGTGYPSISRLKL